MGNVELVIRISQEDYEAIKDNSVVGDMTIPYVFEAIRNGVQLPELHGRLGDLDELEQRISNFVEYDAKITDEYTVTRQRFIVDGIRESPTIIEANDGEENIYETEL